MVCDQIPAPRTWEYLAPEVVHQLRWHVRGCRNCRTKVLAEAPDQLLFDLQGPTLPDEFWLGFWSSIDQKRSLHDLRDHVVLEPLPKIPYQPLRWIAVLVFGLLIFLYGRNLPENTFQTVSTPPSYPVIEEISNPDARYYIFEAGGQGKIVMVFNPDMDL